MNVLGKYDGQTNMRLDSELLDAAESGKAGWRVYGWDGAWVTVGRFQSVERDLIAPAVTKWIRRPTGGKAVLHGHDVTIGLAAPLIMLRDVDPRSIKSVYRAVVAPLVQALKECGVDAALAEETIFSGRGARTGDCFAFSSPNDIVSSDTGKKICGCALRLTQSAVLLQASIPNGQPLVDPASVIVNAEAYMPFEWDSTDFEAAFDLAVSVALEAR